MGIMRFTLALVVGCLKFQTDYTWANSTVALARYVKPNDSIPDQMGATIAQLLVTQDKQAWKNHQCDTVLSKWWFFYIPLFCFQG